MTKRGRAALIFILVIFVAGLAALSGYRDHQNSTQNVTITYKNSHDVAIYRLAGTQNASGDNFTLVSNVTASGKTLRLQRNIGYTLTAKGDSGYVDTRTGFLLGSNPKTIAVNPYYSAAKLESMVPEQVDGVNQALNTKYTDIGLYQVQTGKLYHWGDWYGTILTYKGSYSLISDTLKVVLHKENGQWVIKTDPPNISLSKYSYPSIPVDILKDMNTSSQFNQVPAANPDPGFTGSRPYNLN